MKPSVKFALVVSVLFWIIATALYLTAMLTEFWIYNADQPLNYGLFRTCGSDSCKFL